MPGSFRFEPCPNCCVTGCVYESDDFNRADSTSLGAKWTETAGDWSIDTNRLKIAATANAVCTCATEHPDASTKYIVSVSVTIGTDGDIARVWVDDSAFFAELERITSTCGRLRLYDGATCKGSVNVALGGYTRLVLCSEGDKVHVGTGGSPMLTVPATVASSIVAVGTGACTGTVYFEDFSLSKHAEDDSTCPACGSEGCTWFSDSGCPSSALSPADWSYTGTWAYSDAVSVGRLACTADGVASVVPTDPFDPRGIILLKTGNHPVGITVRLHYDSDDTTYVQLRSLSADTSDYHGMELIAISGGVQYGPTVYSYPGMMHDLRLCFDETSLVATLIGTPTESSVSLPHSPSSCLPRISVTGLSEAPATFVIACTKVFADVPACAACATPSCTACSAGTFANHATVTIANITSNSYPYCSCVDQTIDLYATASGCQWIGTKTGPCSSGTWTATATITSVTGGYKLTVVLTTSGGAGATWEDTVLSGSPVDCLTAFDGDIPSVSFSGTGACTFESATCTFATP